jgi:hypothetical protein
MIDVYGKVEREGERVGKKTSHIYNAAKSQHCSNAAAFYKLFLYR